MKILLIEDERKLADSISVYLIKCGFIVELAGNFEEALVKTGVNSYDCVLVDILLPDGNGLDIIRQMKRDNNQTGIIVVSAKDSLDDKISGLDLGADDYITKPFHLAELNARIKSLIRRKNHNGLKKIAIHEIEIDTSSCQVKIKGNEVKLTKKEYEMLVYFISNEQRVISKENIIEHLWGDFIIEADSYDFLYTHVKNLRKKMAANGAGNYIKTVYGLGYTFKK